VSYTTARYYVSVNGVKVGWVTKIQDHEWRFYATIEDSIKGAILASGERTRREAVRESLATLRIMRLNLETVRDEYVWFEEDVLKELDARLLDEMYPY
jgi:CYTH domain-containing protein